MHDFDIKSNGYFKSLTPTFLSQFSPSHSLSLSLSRNPTNSIVNRYVITLLFNCSLSLSLSIINRFMNLFRCLFIQDQIASSLLLTFSVPLFSSFSERERESGWERERNRERADIDSITSWWGIQDRSKKYFRIRNFVHFQKQKNFVWF